MNDRRQDIPIGCAVNVAIINELSRTDVFNEACINVPLKFNIKPPNKGAPWPFFNISWGSYMMYCLLVVSKEIYNLSKDDDFFKDLIAKDVMKDFKIKKERSSFTENPRYHFKSMRNAISHVHYEVKDDEISFWDFADMKDEDNKEKWHWEVTVSHEDFKVFLAKLNDVNFKFYNEIKEGKREPNGLRIDTE